MSRQSSPRNSPPSIQMINTNPMHLSSSHSDPSSSPTSSTASASKSWKKIKSSLNLKKANKPKITSPKSSLGAMTETINKITEMSNIGSEDKTTAQQLVDELNERPKDWSLFSDNDTWKSAWNIFILFLVMYTVIIIPLNFAFPDLPEEPGLDYTIDVLFVMDVVFTFRTAYLDHNGDEVWDLIDIRKHYFSFWFWIDLVATFPMELLLLAGGAKSGEDDGDASRVKLILRMLKVPRLLRVGRLFKMLDQGEGAGIWRMLQTVFGLIVLAHWFGCSYFFLCRVERESGADTVWGPFQDMWDLQDGNGEKNDIAFVYLQALLTAMYMLIGEGVGPETTAESAYVFVTLVMGAVVMSYLIGNISLVLSNANASAAKHSSKMDEVLDSARAMKVSPTLTKKIIAYYDLLWQRHRLLNASDTFIDELSPPLRKEVHLDLNKVIISRCQLFRGLLRPSIDQDIQKFLTQEEAHQILVAIVDRLSPEVYLTGDSLIAQGEMGREMFFLVKGLVDVVKFTTVPSVEVEESKHEQRNILAEDGSSIPNAVYDPLGGPDLLRQTSTKIVTLGSGAYFGELALLRDASQGQFSRRAASIIAVTPCDTRVFHKLDFDNVVEDFPGLWMYLSHVAAEKYKMPELKVQTPNLTEKTNGSGVGSGGSGGGGGRTAASSAILSQMSRIERVLGAMSRRISNIEKSLVGAKSPTRAPQTTPTSPSSSTMGTPTTQPPSTSKRTPGMTSNSKGPRRVPGSRSSQSMKDVIGRMKGTGSPRSTSRPFDLQEHL